MHSVSGGKKDTCWTYDLCLVSEEWSLSLQSRSEESVEKTHFTQCKLITM